MLLAFSTGLAIKLFNIKGKCDELFDYLEKPLLDNIKHASKEENESKEK